VTLPTFDRAALFQLLYAERAVRSLDEYLQARSTSR
jgi:hypothetical protein